jgi:hypothetical protein
MSLFASLAFMLVTAAAAEAKPEFSSFSKCREMKGFAGFPENKWRWTEGPAPCKGESASNTGNFAESAFVLTKEGVAPVTFTAKGGFTVKCPGDAGQGEITGGTKVNKAFILFTNCADSFGGKCTTKGLTSGQVITKFLDGEIGYIPTTTRVGIDLWSEARTAMERANHQFNAIWAEFSCPSTTVKIRGGLIGETTPLNKAVTGVTGHFTLEYMQKEGIQTLTKLEAVEVGTENQLEASLNGAAYEKLGVSLQEELIPVEAEEIKA